MLCKVLPRFRRLVGCYLYYDGTLCRFVRSGKACGRDANMGTRIDAHATGSRKGGSRFYRMYPDRDKHNSTGGAKVSEDSRSPLAHKPTFRTNKKNRFLWLPCCQSRSK